MSAKFSKSRFFSWLLFGCLALALAGLAATSAAETFKFKTLDPPGAVQSEASGINNRGDIVGDFTDALGKIRGYLLTKGGYTVLGCPFGVATLARGINERGDITGEYVDQAGYSHGFLMIRAGKANVFTPVDFPRATNTWCEGINERGTIVGGYDEPGYVSRGFIYEKGSFTSFDVPGSDKWTTAYGINNKGAVVGGYAVAQDYYFRGFYMYKGKVSRIEDPRFTDLACFGINEQDEIVGWNGLENEGIHGFLYRKGKFVSFDVPGAIQTEAFGINARGDIVGLYFGSDQIIHGFLATNK